MSFILFTAVGTVLGFLTGLGVGGGSLLMLWLTAVIGLEHSAARCINLLFFFPAAMISSSAHLHQKALDFTDILPAALIGAAAAALLTLLSYQMDVTLLRKCFGILLLITGAHEIKRSFTDSAEK